MFSLFSSFFLQPLPPPPPYRMDNTIRTTVVADATARVNRTLSIFYSAVASSSPYTCRLQPSVYVYRGLLLCFKGHILTEVRHAYASSFIEKKMLRQYSVPIFTLSLLLCTLYTGECIPLYMTCVEHLY